MSRIFQITGYPRSGTAWLTTMFNLAPEVMAYHELAMTDSDWSKTLQERASTGQIIGDIGTYQYFPKAVIHNSRKVFINQDPLKSRIRCQGATGLNFSIHVTNQWKRLADNWIAEWSPMIVEFKNLFNLETLNQIWDHCIGNRNVRFPKQKVEQLLKFNIQLHEPAKALSEPGAITRLAELL